MSDQAGTLFIPKTSKMDSRKRWLAHGLQIEGKLVIDSGAESALLKQNTSLLPVGILSASGEFSRGALVSIADENGKELARGLADIPSEELARMIGKKGVGIAIHRDNLVIL